MTSRIFALVFALLATIPSTAIGQGYLYQTGSPSLSTQIPIENGFINVNNGEIHIEIPLATNAQRGKIPLNERLIYDSRIWKIVNTNSPYMWQPTNVANSMGGWRFESGIDANSVNINSTTVTLECFAAGGTATYATNNFSWTDPSGSSHTFALSTVQKTGQNGICKYPPTNAPTLVSSASGYSTDNSGYYAVASNYTTLTIFDKSGNEVYPQLIDPNGNFMSTDSNGNLIDTLGHTPVKVSTSGNSIYYDVLGINGATKPFRYTVTTESVSYSTNFKQSGVSDVNGTFTAIKSISLPDGTSYSFTYDSGTSAGNYGELTSVTLPTGGTISYEYLNFLDSFQNENRWLNTRVKDGGTTTFTPVTLSQCSKSVACSEQTTVTSPAGNDTVYAFSLNQGSYANAGSWNTAISAYQGRASGGVLLKTVSTAYSFSSVPVSTATGFTSYVFPTVLTQTTNLVDAGVSSQTQTSLAYGDPVLIQQWDYYSGSAPSSPTRSTQYSYNYLLNGASLPSQIAITDSSGNQISSMTYGYDESTPTATSGIVSHTSPPSSNRGNLTSQHAWINTSNSTLTTTMAYYDTGSLLSATPPEGKTTYGYDSTNTFATSVTPPMPSSGVSLTTLLASDVNTGLLTSKTDPNKTQIQYNSDDAFGRVGEIDIFDSNQNQVGKTIFTYPVVGQPNTPSVQQYQSASASGNSYTDIDSYGRSDRAAIYNGQNGNNYAYDWYQYDSCFDTSGNLHFRGYSYAGSGFNESKICSGTGGDTYSYDALGRITQITHGDGTHVNYKYTGRATQTTDENGVSRITQVDAFGRPTIICEISSTALTVGTTADQTPVNCGTDIAGTGFVTSYSYNDAAFQTKITQGAQTRTFVTDSLGRTVSTAEPERGTTTYSYAYSSTAGLGLTVTRTRPQANQSSPNTLTNTTTQYDSLGRVVSISYSDGTPTKSYSYDLPNWAEASSQKNYKGRLSLASVGNAGTLYSYDPVGRVTDTWQCTPSGCGNAAYDKHLAYTYDWAGDMTSASDGAGETLSYNYSPAGELLSIVSPQSTGSQVTILSNMTNGPNGPLSYQLGNGLYSVNQFDTLGRRNGGWVCSGSSSPSCNGGTVLYGFTLTTNGSRVNQFCDTVLGGCAALGYDSFNRLTSETATTGSARSDTWTYDRYGNRWAQAPSPVGYSEQASFNAANNQALGFTYDAAGNMLNDGVHTYTYDAEGNMTTVDGGATAKYTCQGQSKTRPVGQSKSRPLGGWQMPVSGAAPVMV